MDYASIMSAALRRPGRAPEPSVMTRPAEPEWQPEYVREPPLESVSPEDWIPNPKSVVAALKGAAPMVMGATKSLPLFRAGKGMFFNPDEAAVREFGNRFGGDVGKYYVEQRRPGREADVENVAKMLGIHQPGTPAGQYLEQGDNAVFHQAGKVAEELRNMGFDSIHLNDGISKHPSVVSLYPNLIKPWKD